VGISRRFIIISALLIVAMMLPVANGFTTTNRPVVNAQDGGDNIDFPYLIVNAFRLNLRTGYGVEFAVLGELRGGERYNVEGISPDLIWFYIVDTPYGDGWVRGRYTYFRGIIRDVPIIGEPTGAPAPSRFWVNIFIPVYDHPLGRPLGLIPGRREYSVTGRSFLGGWVRIVTAEFGEVWTQASRGSFRGYWFNVPIILDP